MIAGFRKSTMAQFNYPSIMRSIASSPMGRKRVQTVAKAKFDLAHQLLLEDFDTHPVTQEIKAGPLTSNISDTLGNNADLFSFIGFENGSSPTEELRNVLETQVELKQPILKRVGGNQLSFEWKVKEPIESIRRATPMPWEGGKSWAEGIEKGISGFGSFMRSFFSATSRSGGGVQVKNQVRGAQFKTRPYISELFDKLAAAFGRKR